MELTEIMVRLHKWRAYLPNVEVVVGADWASRVPKADTVYIVNDDDHWTVYANVLTAPTADYFDSLGCADPAAMKRTADNIQTVAAALPPDRTVTWSRDACQEATQENCGEWTLIYVFARYVCGVSRPSFLLRMRKHHASPRLVHELFASIYDNINQRFL